MTLESIKTSAVATVAAAEERDQAVAEEERAAAELLQLVIDVAKPCLRAIGDSLQSLETVIGTDGTASTHDRKTRYVGLIDSSGPHKLWLREDGTVCESEIVGPELRMRAYPSTLAVLQEWQVGTVDQSIATLAGKLERAIPGLKSRAEKAHKSAARLRAVAELLKK